MDFNSIEYYCLSRTKEKHAYQFLHNVCQKMCDDLGIIVLYVDTLQTKEDDIENEKLSADDRFKTYGTFNWKTKTIKLLNKYYDDMKKYQTWVHEIGHYFEIKILLDLFDEKFDMYDWIQNCKTIPEINQIKQIIRTKEGYIDELIELREFNANYEGFNRIIKSLPAWVICTLKIDFCIEWTNYIMIKNINNYAEIETADYLRFFNYTTKDVIRSWKEFKKENITNNSNKNKFYLNKVLTFVRRLFNINVDMNTDMKFVV